MQYSSTVVFVVETPANLTLGQPGIGNIRGRAKAARSEGGGVERYTILIVAVFNF